MALMSYAPKQSTYTPPKLTTRELNARVSGGAVPMSSVTNRNAANNPYQRYTPAPQPARQSFTNSPVAAPSNNSYSPSVSSQPQPQPSPQYNDIQDQVDDFGAIIDRDYEVAMSGLDAQEGELRGQAQVAEGAISASAAPVRTAIKDAEATNLQGLSTQESQTQTQSTSALQQARDLFRQVQQENVAQLSGLGLSSSSVNEALAEKLGVETARRIAGVTNSTNEIMRNISQERTRVQTFYKNKLSEVETNLSNQLASIQQSLVSGINQINQARQMAAADKANRRQELLSRAQTAVVQLQTQAQQFAQSLDAWNQQKQASLAEAQRFTATAPDQSALRNSIANVQSIAGAGYQPTFNVNSKGEVAYQLKPKKEDEEEVLF